MKIYAQKGSSEQVILNDGITKKSTGFGSNYILMESERPTLNHVADTNGQWVLLESNLETNTNET